MLTPRLFPLRWGDDALEFKPERWFDVPDSVKKANLPGHTLSFIAGPRVCLGMAFSQVEAKVLLMTLLTRFKFEAVKEWKTEPKAALVTQSFIVGQEQYGNQQPLWVSRL